jgi:hypothetical protein
MKVKTTNVASCEIVSHIFSAMVIYSRRLSVVICTNLNREVQPTLQISCALSTFQTIEDVQHSRINHPFSRTSDTILSCMMHLFTADTHGNAFIQEVVLQRNAQQRLEECSEYVASKKPVWRRGRIPPP